MPAELIVVALLAPLTGSLLVALLHLGNLLHSDAGERLTGRLSLGTCGLSLLTLVLLDASAVMHGLADAVTLGHWFAVGHVDIVFTLATDTLGLATATLVAAIALVTQKFSLNYMHREPGFHRFFLLLNLFIAAMLAIVLAGNAIVAFLGWEIAGLTSYLLIGYRYARSAATRNAVYAFSTTRIGDAGFVLAIALALRYFGTTEWAAFAPAGESGIIGIDLIAFGFMLAALAKSAQIPFTSWVTRALEGPTPSSAIFYGSLMIHAGVYLCLRLEPLLAASPTISVTLTVAGALTALYGSLSGLAVTDVKSQLLFGTITQTGLMFVLIGVGAYDAAAWYLGLHAAFRAWQFLLAPSYMHALDAIPARNVPNWLGRRQSLFTAVLARFWLEPASDALIQRPVRALARDLRAMDEQVIGRLVGAPGAQLRDAAAGLSRSGFARGPGLAGTLLNWLADRLHALERRLLLEGERGTARPFLRLLGHYVSAVEELLAQPRYLLLIILAIFLTGL